MKKKLLLATALLASIATNVSAQTDGDYYLYDATNKVFLSRGGSYGTEATADKYGVPFTWTSATGIINFKDWSDTGLHIESNGTSVYTDNAKPTAFAFVETTDGYYLQNADKTSYARHSSGDYGEYVNMTTDATTATVWKLLSKTERDAIVNAYPTTNITNVIATASLPSTTTADNFDTYLSNTYIARSANTIKPTTYSWKQYSRANATSVSPREVYQGTGKFTYTVTGLHKGLYKVTTYGFERDGASDACVTLNKADYNIATASMTANKEQVRIKAWAEDRTSDTEPSSVTAAGTQFSKSKYASSVYTYVDDGGTMELSVVTPSFRWSHWFIFGNTELTYYDDTMTETEANTAITHAQTLLAEPMLATTSSALLDALHTFQTTQNIANYNVLTAAITTAQTSVDAYASAKTALDAMQAEIDNTNVYTTDAYNTYYGNYQTKYDNKTLTTAEATSLQNPTTITGHHADNTVQAFLMSDWGANNWDGLHVNTWSSEGESDGSNFKVPFYEYWTDTKNTSLAEKTMTGTVTGLTAGAYKVSALVRVQKNATTVGDITMKVNDGQTVNVTTGTQTGTTSRYMGTFTAYGRVGSDGKLNIAFDVPASSNISWLSFKNVKYEAVPVTTLSESADNTITAATNASVDLTRTIKANVWNTLVLPFSLTDAQVKAAFGSDAQVAAYTETSNDANNVTVNFNTTTAGITANVPVLLKTSTDGASYSFDNVSIVSGTPVATGTNFDFVGSYTASTDVASGDYLLSNDKLYKSTGASQIAGFRGYLKAKASGAAAITNLIIGGETTGITNVNAATESNKVVRYNLNGQRIYGAAKGLYIENGQKVVK